MEATRKPIPPSYPEAIVKANDRQVELRIPPVGSGYRLFAYVRDTHGGAATANVPLLVKGPECWWTDRGQAAIGGL